MSDFTVVAGVATITDPELFSTWLDRPDYADAVVAPAGREAGPEATANKRLVFEFEAALARMVRDRRVEQDVDAILERFVVEDYLQHDPNIPENGRAALAETFRRIPLDGGTPPPPVCLTVEGDLVCLLMQAPVPDPDRPGSTYDWFIPAVFRVRDGKLCEHWGAFKKMSLPLPVPADV